MPNVYLFELSDMGFKKLNKLEIFMMMYWQTSTHNERVKKKSGPINSGIFYFCQYLHIGAGILSFGGDVFRL